MKSLNLVEVNKPGKAAVVRMIKIILGIQDSPKFFKKDGDGICKI